RDAMFSRRQVIELDRVFAEIRMPRLRSNPVARPLLESRRQKRVGVQERSTVGADAIERDHVVGEWAAGQRIRDGAGAAKERIRRVQQFAEIAAAHRRGWDRRGGSSGITTPDPLLAPEEEQLVAIGIESSRQQDRAAEMESKLVKAERIGSVRNSRI